MDVAVELHQLVGNGVSNEEIESRKRKRSELDGVIQDILKKDESPLLWALEIEKLIGRNGEGASIIEFGEMFVSQLCFLNNHPSMWKVLHRCLSSHALLPFHVVALLSSKIIPRYHSQPEAFRLYLELFSTYPLYHYRVDKLAINSRKRLIKSVDDAFLLSQLYEVTDLENGLVVVLSLFTIIIGLIDCTMHEWGLPMESQNTNFTVFSGLNYHEEDAASLYNLSASKLQHRNTLRKGNSYLALKVLAELTQSERVLHMMHLIKINFPEKFNSLLQRLRYFECHKSRHSILQYGNQLMEKLSNNIQRVLHSEYHSSHHRVLPLLVDVAASKPTTFSHSELGRRSSCWVSFDIHLENAMDKQLLTKPAIKMLIGTLSVGD